MTDLTLWSVSQLQCPTEDVQQTTAARWFAAFSEAVDASLNEPERYWRHHARTLILNLGERLSAEEDRVLPQIAGSISERGSQSLADAWNVLKEDWYPNPRIRRVVQIVLKDSESAERQRFDLLREIIHVGLKQLCLKVALHSPLVLFAWSRSLARETAALADIP